MKELEIDFEQVAIFMEDNSRSSNEYYLDTETGEHYLVPNEVTTALEEGGADRLADWERDFLEVAKAIQNDGEGKFVRIPEVESREAFRFMLEFTNTVGDDELCEKLAIALDGPGAFRRFKNVLSGHPEELKLWYQFRAKKMKDEITSWLSSLDIKARDRNHPGLNAVSRRPTLTTSVDV